MMMCRGVWGKYIGVAIIALLLGCGASSEEEVDTDNPLLARVFDTELRMNELEGMFPDGISQEDSITILRNYVTRWCREAALLHEAEANIPADLNINRLVRDYRASLVRSNYEKILVEQLLDSVISNQELTTFYEENKSLYQLDNPILRCHFIKVPTPTPQAEKLRQMWNSNKPEDLTALKAYCEQYAQIAMLEDSAWYSLDELAANLPEGTLTASNVGSKRDFSQRDDHNQYYFRLFEMKNQREIAPLAYVEDKLRTVILHQRQQVLLQEVRESMYNKGLEKGHIEIFTQKEQE